MASYKMLSKGNWKVVVSLGFDSKGKRQRVTKQGFKTKKDAELFVTETLNKRNRGYLSVANSNMLFKDFIMKWFNEYKIFQLASNTINTYISRLNAHILPALGEYRLSELNTAIIQEFYNSLISEKNMKPSTAKKVMDIVIISLKYAKKNKLIYELPTDIEKQKMNKPKVQYWNQEEVNYFLDYIKGTYLYTPVFIDVLTGLRIGELCGLRWCDIDFDNKILTVNHQLIHDKRLKVLVLGKLKTESSHRTITLPNILIDYLQELKNDRGANDTDYVVLDRKDYKYTPRNLSMNFTKKVNKFALPKEEYTGNISNYMQLKQISFHGLRHTHATLLIANGENIKVVSERLGHTDITMTLNTYTHVLDNMKNETASLLDKIFTQK